MKTLLKCMMMAILMVTIPMLSIGCSKASEKKSTDKGKELAIAKANDENEASPDNDEKKTKEYLVQRVSDIYTDVCDTYNAAQKDFDFAEALANKNFDDLYCTTEWNALLSKVNKYDEEQNPDEIGFFDFDYWIMGQDFMNMSFHDVKVLDMHDNEATVSLTLVNMDSDIELKLSMVYERGDWYIDNFENLPMEFELKNAMKEYIEN